MSKEIVRPIYDTRARILNFTIYPYTTGRVFFDTENQVIYTDIDGQRAARTDLSSIQVLDGNIQEFYERGAKGFENQIMVGRTPTGFRLYYVDNEAQVHNLTFTAESVGSLSERGVTETATFYYAGNWKANKTYIADAFRIAVVKEGSSFYYAKETHTVPLGGAFDSDLWIKFSAQFESVATGLLLAEDAIITRTLTMGEETIDGTTFQGTIKSASVDSLSQGVGFFLGNEDGGVFRVGDPEGNFILWDGTSLTINGGITVDYSDVTGTKPPANADVTSVVIGNGLVTAGSLVARSGTGSNAAGLTGLTEGDGAVRIFAGSNLDNRTSAPFRVTQSGVLTATGANITGVITAQSGSSVDYGLVTGTKPPANADRTQTVIDGGLITTGTLRVEQGGTGVAGITGNDSGDSAVRFFAGSTFANRGSAPFRVTQGGDLTARSVTIRNSNDTKNFIAGNTFYNNLIGNTSITGTVSASFFSGSLILTPNAASIISLDKVDFYVTISGRPGTTLPTAIDSIRLDIQPMLQAFSSLSSTFTNKATSFNNVITIQGINIATQTRYTLVSLDSIQLSGTAKNRVAGPLLCIVTILDVNGNTVALGSGTTIDIAVSAFGFFDPVQLSGLVVSS